MMQLVPVDAAAVGIAADWLAQKENYQWLDFGGGVQILRGSALKIMSQRDIHLIRLFTDESGETPIGLVALSNIARDFRTATVWYVLGDKSYGGQGYTTRAVGEILVVGFDRLGLHAVNAWAVAQNTGSVRVLIRNGFRLIGRQRNCHAIDGQWCDRLLFDLLAEERTRAPCVNP